MSPPHGIHEQHTRAPCFGSLVGSIAPDSSIFVPPLLLLLLSVLRYKTPCISIHTYYPQRFGITPRLRRQLSAVINFVRFKEGKEHLYLDAMAKKQRLAAGIAAAQVRGQREGQPANTQTSQTERTIYCNTIAGLRHNMSCGLRTTAESRSS